jgi:hypothetical protein
MKPFEAYTTYLAVKNHFDREGYDFFKYHGKVPAKIDSFYARKDRYFFEKLARTHGADLIEFLVSNFIENDKVYSRDLTQDDAERVYREWLNRTQSLSYKFEQDLDVIDDLRASIKVKDGQHPELLRLCMSKKISLETLIILDSLVGFIEKWDEKIEDRILWPTVKKKLMKYRPFLKLDLQKFGAIVLKKYKK